jgi:hypothetical protein
MSCHSKTHRLLMVTLSFNTYLIYIGYGWFLCAAYIHAYRLVCIPRLDWSKGDPTIFSKFFGQSGKQFLLKISTNHAILKDVFTPLIFFNSKYFKVLTLNYLKQPRNPIYSKNNLNVICLKLNFEQKTQKTPKTVFFVFSTLVSIIFNFLKFWVGIWDLKNISKLKTKYRGKNVLELHDLWRSSIIFFAEFMHEYEVRKCKILCCF